MYQDYDPCEHGMDSDCCACDIKQLTRQAAEDEAEIVLLQGLLAQVVRTQGARVEAAFTYLHERGLLELPPARRPGPC